MHKDEELKGSGSHVKRSWEEINKGGGEAPSPIEISRKSMSISSAFVSS